MERLDSAEKDVEFTDHVRCFFGIREGREEPKIGAGEEASLLRRAEYSGLDSGVALDAIDDRNEVLEDRRADGVDRLTGTVEQVIDQFARLGELGFTDVIVRQLAAEQADALASLERLGDVRAALADS